MTVVDPQFPRYRVPETTFDGPLVPDGTTETEIKFWVRVGEIPSAADRAEGVPIPLKVFDFTGPKVERDPGPIPEELLAACAERLSQQWDSGEPATARDVAQVVLEEIGRRLHPGDHDAVSLAIGVLKLDVEKLTATGDWMAGFIRGLIDGGLITGQPPAVEMLATWNGQAHRDWSDLHALRRET